MVSQNYRKPPVQHQFKKGHSGNLNGRPPKSRDVIEPGAGGGIFDQVAGMALQEAKRPITVREGDRVEQLPAIQAVIRSMFRSAAQGDSRVQRRLWELVGRAEIDRAVGVRESTTFLLELQAKGDELIAEHARKGLDPPEIYPHPDDIIFDMETGEVKIDGPISKEQAGAHRVAMESAALGLRRYFEIKEQLKKDPKNRALKSELAEHKGCWEYVKRQGQRNIRRLGLELSRKAMKPRPAKRKIQPAAAVKNQGSKSDGAR
jgi:hypothetical protein